MELTRENYMNDKITHQEYYENIARLLGIKFARDDHFEGYSLKKCLDEDEHLNNIPLHLWDGMAAFFLQTKYPASIGKLDPCFGSLSDYVCALKAAARKFVKTS